MAHQAAALCVYLASAPYAYNVIQRQQTGLARLAPFLPLVVFNCWFPTVFRLLAVGGTLTFMATWCANFKLLAACCNRGPLVQKGLGLASFSVLMLLPLNSHKGSKSAVQSSNLAALMSAFIPKFAAFILMSFYFIYVEMPIWWRHILFDVYLWVLVTVVLDVWVPFSYPLLGVQLYPAMNQPFLPLTLREFWSSRWNVIVSSLLRETVHEPILEARLVRPSTERPGPAPQPPSSARRALAVMACFVTSGVMHEVCFWPLCQRWSQLRLGYMTAFFSLQGVCVVLEAVLTRALLAAGVDPGRWSPPARAAATAARLAANLALLAGSAELLFWPPYVDCETDARGMGEVVAATNFVLARLAGGGAAASLA